jgi:hypothetical protein
MIWTILLKDFESHMVNSGIDILNVYYFIRALASVNLLNKDAISHLVTHLVK